MSTKPSKVGEAPSETKLADLAVRLAAPLVGVFRFEHSRNADNRFAHSNRPARELLGLPVESDDFEQVPLVPRPLGAGMSAVVDTANRAFEERCGFAWEAEVSVG